MHNHYLLSNVSVNFSSHCPTRLITPRVNTSLSRDFYFFGQSSCGTMLLQTAFSIHCLILFAMFLLFHSMTLLKAALQGLAVRAVLTNK